MNIGEGIKQTFEVISNNKARSFLTMLGINFGVAGLVAIAIVGLGFRQSINQELGQYGTTLMWIQRNYNAYTWGDNAVDLNYQDVQYFLKNAPGLMKHSALFPFSGTVRFQGIKKDTSIMGVAPGYFDIFAIKLAQGRFFVQEDVLQHRSVCVLRPNIARAFFDHEDPLGKRINLLGKSFQVIGVTERLPDGVVLNDGSDNNSVFVPERFVASRMWGGQQKYLVYLLKFDTVAHVDLAAERYDSYLVKKYGLLRGEKRFRIQKMDSFIQMADTILNIISALILVIASISLIVGGLGIMNIMLVTVTERTKEVGLRKALGATRRNILVQFLIEAVTLCFIGGGIGALFGIGIAAAICLALKWKFFVPAISVIIALAVSTIIGIIFGIYPAYKASKLTPIEALRVEY